MRGSRQDTLPGCSKHGTVTQGGEFLGLLVGISCSCGAVLRGVNLKPVKSGEPPLPPPKKFRSTEVRNKIIVRRECK